MALKEKFFAMIAALDDSEKQQLKDALGSPTDSEQQPEPVSEEQPKTPETPVATEATEGEGEMVKTDSEDEDDVDEEETPTFDKSEPPAPEATPDKDVTPTATPEVPEVPEETPTETPEVPETVSDEQGGDMPMDYQQIIDGLNAKIMALEAENAGLKAKTEGAFGLQSKPGEFARANPLYDDDTSDIHIRK